MKLAVRMPFDDDGFILVEIPSDAARPVDGLVPASRASEAAVDAGVTILEHASGTLRHSLEAVTRFARELRGALRAANPDSVEAEFGFELSAEGGAPLIVRGTAACHVRVRLSWQAAEKTAEK